MSIAQVRSAPGRRKRLLGRILGWLDANAEALALAQLPEGWIAMEMAGLERGPAGRGPAGSA